MFYNGRASYEEISRSGPCYLGYGGKSERSGNDWQRNGGCEAGCLCEYYPRIQSIYRWKGKVVKAQEVLLILKSTKPRYRALEKAIKAMHTYETPEIIALPVQEGLDRYIGWVRSETHS